MPYVPTPLVAGATMVWSDLVTNFSDARAELNALPSTALDNEAIQREHLVRPAIIGFPVNGVSSSFQGSWQGSEVGMVPPVPVKFESWGPKIQRLTVRPLLTRGQVNTGTLGSRWMFPIGKTETFVKAVSVTAICQFDLQVRSSNTVPIYPLGATGDIAGTFALMVYDRATGEELLPCLRNAYPLNTTVLAGTADTYVDRVSLLSVTTLSAGSYDFGLVYYRGEPSDLVAQLDLTSVGFHLEAL